MVLMRKANVQQPTLRWVLAYFVVLTLCLVLSDPKHVVVRGKAWRLGGKYLENVPNKSGKKSSEMF